MKVGAYDAGLSSHRKPRAFGSVAVAPPLPSPRARYERRRPERTALYEVVRDNLETLYGAVEDGALEVRIAKHARKVDDVPDRSPSRGPPY